MDLAGPHSMDLPDAGPMLLPPLSVSLPTCFFGNALQTFEYACLMRDFAAAERLLGVLQFMAAQAGPVGQGRSSDSRH